MKKQFSLLMAGLLMSICVIPMFAANDRADIDKFFKSYEEYVIAYEKAAKKSDLTTLSKLSMKSLEMTDKLSKIQNTKAWTTKDTIRYNELTLRLSKAMEKQQGTVAPANTGMYKFSY